MFAKRWFPVLLLLIWGCAGTKGANPGQPAPTVLITIEAGPIASAISQLQICPSEVKLTAAPGGTDVVAPLEMTERSLGSGSTIASVSIPQQSYDGIELRLSQACASSRSMRITNTNGTFQSTETIVLAFNGTFTATHEQSIRLDIVPLTNQLASVSSDTQIKTTAEAAIGTLAPSPCPPGFVLVPPQSGYTSSAFCVMKYEAKSVGEVATSQAALTPWVNVSRDYARGKCQNLGVKYDLIDNNQWQSIARNIEIVATNWTNGALNDTGGVNLGHSDGVPASPLAAASSDVDACFGTGQTCSDTVHHRERRIHFLSNGSVLWDFAGNVWEWVLDNNSTTYGADIHISGLAGAGKPLFGPGTDWSLHNTFPYAGMGYARVSVSSGAFVRGGSYVGLEAGIFSVDLNRSTGIATPDGFRCVYEP
jgi:hypothetical protein